MGAIVITVALILSVRNVCCAHCTEQALRTPIAKKTIEIDFVVYKMISYPFSFFLEQAR